MISPCFVQNAVYLRRRGQSATLAIASSPFRGNRLQVSTLSMLRSRLYTRPMEKIDYMQTSTIRMESDSSSVSPVTRVVAGALVLGLILTTFLPLAGVFRNAGTDNGSAVADSQLGKVPVFTVTDETGRPYLSETEDHRLRRGYFFIQPADAQKYLELVRKDEANAKVLTIGLNEAMKVLERSSPAKSIPERFEIFPDEHEAEIAQTVTDGAFQSTFGPSAVPIFFIDGLGIKDSKEGATVFPLFFEKEKLDETLEDLKRTDPKASLDGKDVQVIDLTQTLREIRTGGNPRLNRVVFIPLSEALKAMKSTAAEAS